MKLCKNCGEMIAEEKAVCPYCGTRTERKEISAIDQIEDQKEYQPFGLHKNVYNKWISFFLCLFLGWLGAHKFYERKYIVGIFYLLTGGIFGIGWILDIIILIQKPNPYYLYQ